MSRLQITLVGIVVLAAAVGLALWLAPPVLSEPRTPSSAAGLVARGYDSQGTLLWQAEATRSELLPDTAEMRPARLSFYNEEQLWLTVHADRLERVTGGATLDGVSVVQDTGLAIQTDRMTWDETRGQLVADAAECRWENGDAMTCRALSVDTKAARARLDHVVARIERGEVFDIEAAAGDLAGERIVLLGGVRLVSSQTSVAAQSLDTSVHASEATLQGDVTVESSGLRLRADSLTIATAGQTARGDVHVEVDLASLGGPDGP
jgi:lipopolysaccharide export system protein LptA